MSLVNELDETIELLEADIPANPASKKNERVENGMQRSLAGYFRSIDKAIDWTALEQIYYRNVKQE